MTGYDGELPGSKLSEQKLPAIKAATILVSKENKKMGAA
jgi:hypothetical protein